MTNYTKIAQDMTDEMLAHTTEQTVKILQTFEPSERKGASYDSYHEFLFTLLTEANIRRRTGVK